VRPLREKSLLRILAAISWLCSIRDEVVLNQGAQGLKRLKLDGIL
jgi:hypothetical protein